MSTTVSSFEMPTNASALDGHEVIINGVKYRVTIERDDHQRAPWEEEDGHGPVSDWVTREADDGERLLATDAHGTFRRYYDFAKALKIARRDGWGDPTPNKPGIGALGHPTDGEIAHRAAEADFERLRAWCNDEWHYVGIVVTPSLDGVGSQSLWGIESEDTAYMALVARDLIVEAAEEVQRWQPDFMTKIDQLNEAMTICRMIYADTKTHPALHRCVNSDGASALQLLSAMFVKESA